MRLRDKTAMYSTKARALLEQMLDPRESAKKGHVLSVLIWVAAIDSSLSLSPLKMPFSPPTPNRALACHGRGGGELACHCPPLGGKPAHQPKNCSYGNISAISLGAYPGSIVQLHKHPCFAPTPHTHPPITPTFPPFCLCSSASSALDTGVANT